MTQPAAWVRTHQFSTELGNQHGINLDQELDNGRLTVEEIRDNLGLIQRDDGALQNDSVTPDSLDSATLALIASGTWTPRGIWAITTLYNIGDIVEVGTEGSFVAVTQHISGASFAVDKAAGKWVTLSGVTLSTLGSTADGFGASLVGVDDDGGYFTSDDAEGALQELGAADAATAAAIVPFARTFDTIAQMKAATPRHSTEKVSVMGYFAAGDSGGGQFYWDAASAAADNGGTVIQLNIGGTGRWKRVLTDREINVRWFGAVGVDGTDDYTTAITNARAASSSLYFPVGTYVFTSAITASDGVAMQIRGDGAGRTFLRPAGSFDVIRFHATGVGLGGSGGGIRDLTINAANMVSGNVISVVYYDRCVIRDIVIIGGYNGIYVQDQNVTTLNNVWMNNQIGQYGIKYYSATTTLANVLDIDNVQLGFAANTAGAPIGIWLDGGVSTVDMRHVAVVKGSRGLQITNTPNLVEGPQFVTAYDFQSDFPYAEGIYINGGSIPAASVSIHRYTDCYVHGSVSSHGVHVDVNTRDVQFNGGFFSGHFKGGFLLNGRFAKLLGAQIANNSLAGLDLWPSVTVGATSLITQIHNNFIGQFVGYAAEKTSNAVKILAGAQRYSIKDNNFLGYDTKYDVLDQAGFTNDSASETSPNTHQINDQAFVVRNPGAGPFTYTMGRHEKLIINAAGVLANFDVTAAATPPHGQEAQIISYRAVTAFTFNPNNTVITQTVDAGSGAVVALAANVAVAWKFDQPSATWYRFL